MYSQFKPGIMSVLLINEVHTFAGLNPSVAGSCIGISLVGFIATFTEIPLRRIGITFLQLFMVAFIEYLLYNMTGHLYSAGNETVIVSAIAYMAIISLIFWYFFRWLKTITFHKSIIKIIAAIGSIALILVCYENFAAEPLMAEKYEQALYFICSLCVLAGISDTPACVNEP
jgi:hypothetical protein